LFLYQCQYVYRARHKVNLVGWLLTVRKLLSMATSGFFWNIEVSFMEQIDHCSIQVIQMFHSALFKYLVSEEKWETGSYPKSNKTLRPRFYSAPFREGFDRFGFRTERNG
jgi:hypothetical protein